MCSCTNVSDMLYISKFFNKKTSIKNATIRKTGLNIGVCEHKYWSEYLFYYICIAIGLTIISNLL